MRQKEIQFLPKGVQAVRGKVGVRLMPSVRMLSLIFMMTIVWSWQFGITVGFSTVHLQYHQQQHHCHHQFGQSDGRSSRMLLDLKAHTLAILTMPITSRDRIANEAILETAMRHLQLQEEDEDDDDEYCTSKLSVVLRCRDDDDDGAKTKPTLAQLRGYVGEVYSMAWDCALGLDDKRLPRARALIDVIVYPTGLPNLPPEDWLHHRPDLTNVCSHDSMVGWTTVASYKDDNQATSSGGGLKAHVEAINYDRSSRSLPPVQMLPVDNWPLSGDSDEVVFLEDEDSQSRKKQQNQQNQQNQQQQTDNSDNERQNVEALLTGKYVVPADSLFQSVAVGGTFDGMHYGHRKLLTLAVSSVNPIDGKLLVGITTDEMLQQKAYADLIPSLKERTEKLKEFLGTLSPGLKNHMKIVPIYDTYGPPGADDSSEMYSIPNDFDALVLSHETLATGQTLNHHRVHELNLAPLTLLCTRRTEPHGMSSTALRRLKKTATNVQSQQQQQEEKGEKNSQTIS